VYLPCNTLTKKMGEATFTFRVDEELKNEFASAAKSRDRTGAQLLRDFMRDFVRQQQEVAEHDAWFRGQVQAGLDAANAGELIAAEDVEAEAATWRAETRRKLAGNNA
jgi:predicted transcriptional regulator